MSSITKFKHFNQNSNSSRRVCSATQKPHSAATLRRHYRQRVVRLLALKDCNVPNLPQLMTPPEISEEDLFVTTPIASTICHVGTNPSPPNRLTCAERRASFGSRRTASTTQSTERNANTIGSHTATVYEAATQMPILDLYNYTAISSRNQRQQYCLEYERVCGVYQALTAEMQRQPEDTAAYVRAKERATEYMSKNVEEMLQRQHRCYYLRIKMMHILKLIADYDDSLSSRNATARLAAAAADYLQRQQQQAISTTDAGDDTMRHEQENVDHALQPQPTYMELTVANLKRHDAQQEKAKMIWNCISRI